MENILFYLEIVAMILMAIATITSVLSVRKKWKRSNAVDRIRLDSKTEKSKNGGGRLDELADKLVSKVFWNFAIPIVGLGLLAVYWYYQTTTKIYPGDIGKWIWDYWIQILIVYGIGAGLIWLNAEEKTAKTLQKVLVGGVIMFLAVFPVWSWIVSPSSTSQNVSRSETTLAKMLPRNAPGLPRAWNKDGSRTDTFEWPRVEVPPGGGDSVHVPGILDGHVVWVWNGSGLTIRCVHEDRSIGIVGDTSNPCHTDNVVESYMHNEGPNAEGASYAYARRGEK